MTNETILLTGGNGHVGFAVLREALVKGYHVRAAVRSEAKADTVKAAKSIQPYLSKLQFTIVKDVTVPGAYDDAIKGVDAVVHVASPIPVAEVKDFEQELIKPAVQGTTGILHAALKEKSVRRVVITSSLAAVLSGNDEVSTADSPGQDWPLPHQNAMIAYCASKTAANNSVKQFIEREKPDFTVVSIMPSYVLGANELASSIDEVNNGSNAFVLAPLLGIRNDEGTFTSIVHLDDVVDIHIAALDPKLKGHRNFGANYDYKSGFKWDDVIEMAGKEFPEAVKSGILPLGGHTTDIPVKFDASETEKVLNLKFRCPAEIVKSVVGQYIECGKPCER